MKCKLERLKGIDVPNSINFIEQGNKLIIRMPKEAIIDYEDAEYYDYDENLDNKKEDDLVL